MDTGFALRSTVAHKHLCIFACSPERMHQPACGNSRAASVFGRVAEEDAQGRVGCNLDGNGRFIPHYLSVANGFAYVVAFSEFDNVCI